MKIIHESERACERAKVNERGKMDAGAAFDDWQVNTPVGLCVRKLMKGTVFRTDIACRQTYSAAIFVVVMNASEGP